MTAPTTVTVAGGYLGAGKTTLVNHLLRNAPGARLAVLVNDFGTLPIDADLIEARSGDLISIAGGCICCSFGSDLIGALMTLSRRRPRPEHVLIETSGVALPGIVARSVTLIPSFCLDSVVVVADAETVRTRAADRYMGDTIARQLREADLVLLNKLDLVGANALEDLRAWLEEAAPRARLIESVRARVPRELLFGRDRDPLAAGGWSALSPAEQRPLEDAAARYVSAAFAPNVPLDVERLASDLSQRACGLIRAKGVLRDADGTLKTLHIVGSRFEVMPFSGPANTGGGLVCIGLAGRIDRARIERAIAHAAHDILPDAADRRT